MKRDFTIVCTTILSLFLISLIFYVFKPTYDNDNDSFEPFFDETIHKGIQGADIIVIN